MRRSVWQRAAACLLALLAQAGFIALFMVSKKQHVEPESDSSQRLTFIQWIEQTPEVEPRHRARLPRRITPNETIAVSVVEPIADSHRDAVPDGPETTADAPPDSAPRVHWQAVMESTARAVGKELEERERNGELLDSKLKAMDIPERPHKAGDEERYPDGAVVTWLGERCYVLLDPAGSGPKPLRICKRSTLAERRAESRRKELESAMMPEYLRRPLPKPRPPDPSR
jgi:hypothetical protein